MKKHPLTVAIATAAVLASGAAMATQPPPPLAEFAKGKTVWFDSAGISLSDSCLAAAIDAELEAQGTPLDGAAAAALAAALSYVTVFVDQAAVFQVEWSGRSGAVKHIDFGGAAIGGNLTLAATLAGAGAGAVSSADAAAVAGASASTSLIRFSFAGAGAEAGSIGAGGAGGITGSIAATGGLNAMLSAVSVDGSNITEFKGGILMGGLTASVSGSFASELAAVLTAASAEAVAGAYAQSGLSSSVGGDVDGELDVATAAAAANALAAAIGGSAFGVATTAHYKKLPGNKNTDIIELKQDGSVSLIGCAAGGETAVSTSVSY